MMAFTESCRSDFGSRRWMYGAAVMEDRLGKMIEQKKINKESIPKGVFLGMQRFFQLVIGPGGSCKFSENLSTGLVAANALAESNPEKAYSLQRFFELMERFSLFFNSLNENRDLSSDELEIAEEMRAFFRQIGIAGERLVIIPL